MNYVYSIKKEGERKLEVYFEIKKQENNPDSKTQRFYKSSYH